MESQPQNSEFRINPENFQAWEKGMLVWFGLCFYDPVNSYGHVKMVRFGAYTFVCNWHQPFFCLFDSLRPINNLSVMYGQVFLGWTSTKLW